MKNIVRGPVWVALLLAAGLVVSAQAASTTSDVGNQAVSAKKKKSAGGQVSFLPGSAETAKERSSRLRRECQGGVNAGACAGYTR